MALGGGFVAALAGGMPAMAVGGIAEAAPIGRAERMARLGRAQALMRANGMAALLVEAGSSLNYFTGVKWWRSERLTAAVLPADGELCVFTPGFEEPSIREMLVVPGDVKVWQEDENPAALVADWLKSHKLAGGVIGIEDTVRFFAIDGLQKALPGVRIVNGAAIVNGCRMIKTPAEIALMQRASDITIAAYRAMSSKVEPGMGTADVYALMAAAVTRLGGDTPSGGVQINEGSALPHGSREPQFVRAGSVVLMDCGCTVDGYHADISRTFVFGEATRAQRTMWDEVHRGQEIALAAAKVGAAAGTVDDAVRVYYEKLGYGPGYRTPGLPHRTGHGIGLDVHEPVNLVHGETTKLAPGMCFSNEPGLYRPGSYGVRLEDCFYMTASGPRWFSVPPPSIDNPFG
ncbi:X-Pro dipeptidase [Polymorphobacter glacialis]|uniref:X-Pro dipeptidase n=2 Tax=Sandarakinorhabdus glacialis TaxID=1614636 RepID=A0A917E8K3_9SPHN|nr:X-Pro dipeptidase [Polymorphobacter glacialis]